MKLYFIGIGGISMSALAQFLADQGHQVSGSDLTSTDAIARLEVSGIKVFIPQKKENIKSDIDEVIYTSAITPGSPGDAELQEARQLGIKTIKRAQKIGELTKRYKTIAISGTHGKSTTTAMILQILIEAGLDPSALLGSGFDLIGSNYRVGKGKYLVIEADEFDRSFHSFQVDFGAILNLEPDHLDYFTGGFEEIKETFKIYLGKNFKKNATLVYNQDDQNLVEVVKKLKRDDLRLITFGKSGDYKLGEIKLKLKIPGEHNRLNALAALALAESVGVKREVALQALAKFKGAERRLDFRGTKNKALVFDDYGHHPTEVKATLQAMREKYPKNKLIVVFQPHQYSRTHFFAADFAKAFKDADLVIIPPIYEVPGRDEEKKIDNKKLTELVKKNNQEAMATKSFEETVKLLNKITKPGDIVLVMGAGPVTEISAKFLNLKSKN